ncbi:MAG: SAM-dependent methyltransferase [Nocardiopsaceae bacterium]|nr:SAM-dependent methyltransferase [Nocardiopsaceae bacterium]
MELDAAAKAALDPSRPNVARVWDYWLGGKNHFAADREQAERMWQVFPRAGQLARENRQFLDRAVSYVAGQGIRQFIDVGAGLPTVLNTHEIAQREAPSSKVAYVDNDPVVVRHAEALLATHPSVIALRGDARDPLEILSDPGLLGLVDLAAPVCVVLCAVLHFLDAGAASKTATAFVRAIAPGSYVIMSVGTGEDPDVIRRFEAEYQAARLHSFSLAEFTGFFDGLTVVPPGLLPAQDWRADEAAGRREPPIGYFLVGVGRKEA